MFGAITGDVIGSIFEWQNIKTTNFPLFSDSSHFTDDTVMTVAVANALINKKNYLFSLKELGKKYPNVDYGDNFRQWLFSRQIEPNKSYGNGAAMRVSAIGFFFDSLENVLKEAENVTNVSHNHEEARRGAKAIASAIFLAKRGENKDSIKKYIEENFNYNLHRQLDEIRPNYKFDESCQGSVPEAIIAFLESIDFEDAIRKAVSLGGDSDTIACMTGSIAEAFYKKIPSYIIKEVKKRLTSDLLDIVEQFYKHIE